MKKIKTFSLLAMAAAFGLVACNNSSDSTTTSADSTANATTTTTDHTATNTTMKTSKKNYSALADTFKTNSKAGYYLNPKSGKPYKGLSIDTSTGALTEMGTNQPVKRYVDKRSWQVYDASTYDTIGSARMEKGSLKYRGDNDKWMNYEDRWKDAADSMGNNMNNGRMNNMNTTNNGDSAMSGSDMNTDNTGTSGNAGGNGKLKIKADGHKIKVSKNGEVKEKD